MSSRKLSANVMKSGNRKNKPSHRKGGEDKASNVDLGLTTKRLLPGSSIKGSVTVTDFQADLRRGNLSPHVTVCVELLTGKLRRKIGPQLHARIAGGQDLLNQRIGKRAAHDLFISDPKV